MTHAAVRPCVFHSAINRLVDALCERNSDGSTFWNFTKLLSLSFTVQQRRSSDDLTIRQSDQYKAPPPPTKRLRLLLHRPLYLSPAPALQPVRSACCLPCACRAVPRYAILRHYPAIAYFSQAELMRAANLQACICWAVLFMWVAICGVV
jgi:hypothetical protein